MTFGYARVSTDRQDAERQVSEILEHAEKHGLGDVAIIRETASGTKARPELGRLLGKMGDGDTLMVWELSRLTRGGVGALFKIVEQIREAGGKLLEVKGDITLNGSVQSEALTFALGLAARIERDLISERTRSALKARKAAGVKLGRPSGKSKLDARSEEIHHLLTHGVSVAAIARLVGVARSTLLAWLKRHPGGTE